MSVDWARYKQLCDHPSYFTSWTLQTSLRELARSPMHEASAGTVFLATLEEKLRAALAATPLELPDGHNADPRTEMHQLALAPAEAAHMVELFQILSTHPHTEDQVGDDSSAEQSARSANKSWIGHRAAWLEHCDYVCQGTESAGNGA